MQRGLRPAELGSADNQGCEVGMFALSLKMEICGAQGGLRA